MNQNANKKSKCDATASAGRPDSFAPTSTSLASCRVTFCNFTTQQACETIRQAVEPFLSRDAGREFSTCPVPLLWRLAGIAGEKNKGGG